MRFQAFNIAARRSFPVLAVSIILVLLPGMSNTILGGTRTVHYDEGATQDVPSAAARICNLKCIMVPGGCAYSFDVEVFGTCWEPVYAIEIEALTAAVVEPIDWPDGWKAGTVPAGLTRTGSMIFYTDNDPIAPGSIATGFGLVSYSGETALRWFPADGDGILIGKASRLDLSCPAATESRSWGAIKAVYR